MRGTSHTGSYLGDLIPGNVLSSYISADLACLVPSSASLFYPFCYPLSLASQSLFNTVVVACPSGARRGVEEQGKKIEEQEGGEREEKTGGEVLKLLDPRSRKPTRMRQSDQGTPLCRAG